MVLYESAGRVYLKDILPSSPVACIRCWRSRIKGAWLIQIGDTKVTSVEDVANEFAQIKSSCADSTVLLFSHPEVRPTLSQDGLPIVSSAPFSLNTHTQLNNRWEFSTVASYLRSCKPGYTIVNSGDVRNVVTRVMRLIRGKLLKQPDWHDWQAAEFLQYRIGTTGRPQNSSNWTSMTHRVCLDNQYHVQRIWQCSTRCGHMLLKP